MSQIQHKLEQKLFTQDLPGGQGELEYQITDKKELAILHTEVPPEAEGKGHAGELVKAAVKYAKEEGMKVLPLCPYAKTYLSRHKKEYGDVVVEG